MEKEEERKMDEKAWLTRLFVGIKLVTIHWLLFPKSKLLIQMFAQYAQHLGIAVTIFQLKVFQVLGKQMEHTDLLE